MKAIKIILILILLNSCDTDNCDLSEYPSSPLSEPYAVEYGDDFVKYTYVCIDNYNEIYTYKMVGECWELYLNTQYNSRC